MKLTLNKNIKNIFLSKNIQITEQKEQYNIILSPEFYWVRVFEAPVKSKKEFLKLVPTLFEDILPSDNFEYHAIKLEENKFLSFAYKSEDIVSALKEKGLFLSKLKNVYLAQSELIEQVPFKVEEFAYISKDNILIQIPANFIQEELEELKLTNIKLSNENIKLNLHQNIINKKNIITISSIFFIIALINFVNIFQTKSEMDNIDLEKTTIQQKYKLPRTTIQLNSIKKRLIKTDKKQSELRKTLNDIFSIYKRYPKSQIIHVNNSKKVVFDIKNVAFNSVQNHLRAYKLRQLSNKNGVLRIEVRDVK